MPQAQRYAFFTHPTEQLACHDIFLILSCSVFTAVAGVCASRVAGFQTSTGIILQEGTGQERRGREKRK